MEHYITQLFIDSAYSPFIVYGAICLFMILSAFGLPLPEELVLVSAGLIGHMSLHPDQYPPPISGAQSVNVLVLAVVAFFAVMGSDYLIYSLGRNLGPRLFKMRWFARLVSVRMLERVQRWMHSHGSWAVIIFRFTPGVRFPGHLSCGAMGLSTWRFLVVDSLAAGLSVPTQVLLVSFYGGTILHYFARFKIAVLLVISLVAFSMVTLKATKRLSKRLTAHQKFEN